MAIVKDDEESRTKERSVGGGTSFLGGGYVGGGSASAPSYGASGGGGGSNFTNIGQYLMGMEGQGQEMAGKLSSDVSNQGDQAMRDIDSLQGNASVEIGTHTPGMPSADELNKVQLGVQPDPISYTGQTDFTQIPGYLQAKSSADNMGVTAKNLGTFEGVQSMLQKGKGADYSKGMSRYDAMLARAGGNQTLGEAAKKASSVGDSLGKVERNFGKDVGIAKQQAKSVNDAWQNTYKYLQKNPGWGGVWDGGTSKPVQKNLVVPPAAPAAPVAPVAPKYNGKPQSTADQLSQLFTQDPLLTGYSYKPSEGFTNKDTAPLTPMAAHNTAMDFAGTFNPLEGIAPTPNIKPLTDKIKVPKKSEQFKNWRW